MCALRVIINNISNYKYDLNIYLVLFAILIIYLYICKPIGCAWAIIYKFIML